jgi:hypothetical protein
MTNSYVPNESCLMKVTGRRHKPKEMKVDESHDILVQEMYMYLIEVKSSMPKGFVHCKQTPSLLTLFIIVDYCGLCLFLLSSFGKGEWLCRGSRVSCRGADPLLGAEHGLDHFTTTDAKNREE